MCNRGHGLTKPRCLLVIAAACVVLLPTVSGTDVNFTMFDCQLCHGYIYCASHFEVAHDVAVTQCGELGMTLAKKVRVVDNQHISIVLEKYAFPLPRVGSKTNYWINGSSDSHDPAKMCTSTLIQHLANHYLTSQAYCRGGTYPYICEEIIESGWSHIGGVSYGITSSKHTLCGAAAACRSLGGQLSNVAGVNLTGLAFELQLPALMPVTLWVNSTGNSCMQPVSQTLHYKAPEDFSFAITSNLSRFNGLCEKQPVAAIVPTTVTPQVATISTALPAPSTQHTMTTIMPNTNTRAASTVSTVVPTSDKLQLSTVALTPIMTNVLQPSTVAMAVSTTKTLQPSTIVMTIPTTKTLQPSTVAMAISTIKTVAMTIPTIKTIQPSTMPITIPTTKILQLSTVPMAISTTKTLQPSTVAMAISTTTPLQPTTNTPRPLKVAVGTPTTNTMQPSTMAMAIPATNISSPSKGTVGAPTTNTLQPSTTIKTLATTSTLQTSTVVQTMSMINTRETMTLTVATPITNTLETSTVAMAVPTTTTLQTSNLPMKIQTNHILQTPTLALTVTETNSLQTSLMSIPVAKTYTPHTSTVARIGPTTTDIPNTSTMSPSNTVTMTASDATPPQTSTVHTTLQHKTTVAPTPDSTSYISEISARATAIQRQTSTWPTTYQRQTLSTTTPSYVRLMSTTNPPTNRPQTALVSTPNNPPASGWVKDNQREFYVSRNETNFTEATDACKNKMNASMLFFTNALQYLDISKTLQLTPGNFWVGVVVNGSHHQCLQLRVEQNHKAILSKANCRQMAASICSRASNVSDVLDNPSFVRLIADMTVDSSKTQRAKRKLVSVYEERKSATAVGSIGVIVVVSVLTLIALLDLTRLKCRCRYGDKKMEKVKVIHERKPPKRGYSVSESTC